MKAINCKKCHRRFFSPGLFYKHRPYCLKCIKCNEKFDSSVSFRAHIRDAHNNQRRRCGQTFKPALARKYLSPRTRLKCTICGHNFKDKKTLVAHACACPHCGRRFKRGRDFPAHVKDCTGLKCTGCGNQFSSRNQLVNHLCTCPRCGRSFKIRRNYRRHQLICKDLGIRFTCDVCHRDFKRETALEKHRCSKKAFTCNLCYKQFNALRQLIRHGGVCSGKVPHPEPSTSSEPSGSRPAPEPVVFDDPEMNEIYDANRGAIRTHQIRGRFQSIFNFETGNADLEGALWGLFREQKRTFKINCSHHFVLKNTETDKLRFFHASQNKNRLFTRPITITNRQDFERFLEEFKNKDSVEYARANRPNSKYRVHKIMATSFYINPMNEFAIGCADDPIPEHIKRNKFIKTLTRSEHTKCLYKDNLCFFRCLALHYKCEDVDSAALNYFARWVGDGSEVSRYQGVDMSELPELETFF